jgi:hypothetical protein
VLAQSTPLTRGAPLRFAPSGDSRCALRFLGPVRNAFFRPRLRRVKWAMKMSVSDDDTFEEARMSAHDRPDYPKAHPSSRGR